MNKLIGTALLGQSGGPTSVINASAAGVFLEALKHAEITNILAAAHGIQGILDENFYDIRQEDLNELNKLLFTPSSAIGSVRYKLADVENDNTDYIKILEVFKKYNIRYFFYNGGNDSMDTCLKISRFFKSQNYECHVIGIPKTIDNDLVGIDHSPGFGSAAKYVATSIMELCLDASVYSINQVIIVEVMGRNAGWLTASAALAKHFGAKVDLIYLPEVPFDIDNFFTTIGDLLKKQKDIVVVVSEGIKNKNGLYIPEVYKQLDTDAFGHVSLGGTAQILADKVKEKFAVKVRSVEFSLLQRCAAHLASKVDIDEAFTVGKFAVINAINGVTDKFIGIKRISNHPYHVEYPLVELDVVANSERKVPLEWILPNGGGLTKDFIDYSLPLIQGDSPIQYQNGLPNFAKLRKIPFKI